MTAFHRRTLLVSGAGLTAVALAACGAGGSTAEGPKEKNGVTTITIGASPVPHAKILQFVQDSLAKKAGLQLKITQYTDYQIPNRALSDGDLDANYYQTPNFLKDQEKEKGYEFFAFKGVHIEPMGLYSKKATKLDQIPAGAEIAIPNDTSNRARALSLLADNGLITFKAGVEKTAARSTDVDQNAKNLTFREVEAAQIPRSLGDFGAAVINGNYALEAGLKPNQQAIVLEKGKDSPYANIVVCRAADKDNAGLKKLDELLHSAEVKAFIEKTWTDGAVIPAF